MPAVCFPVPRMASLPWWSPMAKQARLDWTFATARGRDSAEGTGVANRSVTPYLRPLATIFVTSSAACSPMSERNSSWHSSMTTTRGRMVGSAAARRRVSFGSPAADSFRPRWDSSESSVVRLSRTVGGRRVVGDVQGPRDGPEGVVVGVVAMQ
ncbi:hypothetical protein Ae717Ps2_6576c [Pseudonocardia sp. Ae717_Ps2]|nr:hypothetical protein Ae717Ps2_6576c [Pseudonocardia sp. Ae717_Ps2]